MTGYSNGDVRKGKSKKSVRLPAPFVRFTRAYLFPVNNLRSMLTRRLNSRNDFRQKTMSLSIKDGERLCGLCYESLKYSKSLQARSKPARHNDLSDTNLVLESVSAVKKHFRNCHKLRAKHCGKLFVARSFAELRMASERASVFNLQRELWACEPEAGVRKICENVNKRKFNDESIFGAMMGGRPPKSNKLAAPSSNSVISSSSSRTVGQNIYDVVTAISSKIDILQAELKKIKSGGGATGASHTDIFRHPSRT